MESQQFFDMKPEEVLRRKDEVGPVRTLAGIKGKYEYICQPDGEVMWRKYPCCCHACLDLRWKECSVPELVEELETVVEQGRTLYSTRRAGEKGWVISIIVTPSYVLATQDEETDDSD